MGADAKQSRTRRRRKGGQGSQPAGEFFEIQIILLPMNQHLEQHGFAIISKVLSADEVQQLCVALGTVDGAGRRGLLAEPAVAHFARSARLIELVRPHLPVEPCPVRAVYFNKTAEANWLVAWHQDLTIAVKERIDLPGSVSYTHLRAHETRHDLVCR